MLSPILPYLPAPGKTKIRGLIEVGIYALALFLLMLAASLAAAQPCYTYRLIDLPLPAGTEGQTTLESINHAGVILGRYAAPDLPGGYTLVRQGRTKLRVRPLGDPAAGLQTEPRAINRQRDVAGLAFDVTEQKWIGYVRRHLRQPTIQRVEVPGAGFTQVLGMNSKRDLVGSYAVLHAATNFFGPSHGFWRYKGEFLTLDAPDADAIDTMLTGINVHQDIIGWYNARNGYHGLHIVDGLPVTLDVPDADYTFLYGLNDQGDIVGAYVLDQDSVTTVGRDALQRGFLYHDGEFVTIVPNVGEIFSEAVDISNAGEIVGNYMTPDGLLHGYVATPTACAAVVAQR